MESEKVKEIKKALSCSAGDFYAEPIDCKLCKFSDKGIYSRCKGWKLAKDSLTLINELESENEKLAKAGKRVTEINEELSNTHKKIEEQLKDRIAKLKKENQKYHEVATNCQKIAFMGGVCDTKLALKHFAERLKEKIYENENGYIEFLSGENAVAVDIVDFENCLDKTLKECINNK